MSKASRQWKEYAKINNPLRKNRSKKIYLGIKKRIVRFEKEFFRNLL